MHAKRFLIIGALLAMFSVILGAFGAHLLKNSLTEARFETFSTAVDYQFWHALGLMIVGVAGLNSAVIAGALPDIRYLQDADLQR